MNIFDLNSDNITMNIDGKDIEMKHPICYDKKCDKWLVSKCGKVWSIHFNKLISGRVGATGYFSIAISTPKGFWEDGSGYVGADRLDGNTEVREIKLHKMVIDTWAPLYDNPPVGILWEEWEIARDLPSVYNHISKTIVIDHIDDDPTNNHLNNLRRVTQWDNNKARKAKGI